MKLLNPYHHHPAMINKIVLSSYTEQIDKVI